MPNKLYLTGSLYLPDFLIPEPIIGSGEIVYGHTHLHEYGFTHKKHLR